MAFTIPAMRSLARTGTVLLALVFLAPARAHPQSEAPAPVQASEADSLEETARLDGRSAAEEERIRAYFQSGVVGGLPLGHGGGDLLRGDKSGRDPKLRMAVGLGTVAGMTMWVGRSPVALPPAVTERIQDRPLAYQQSFRDAYVRAIHRRRIEATILGGFVGAGIGAGVVYLLASLAPYKELVR
jgi:hypothetical protein